MEGRLPTYHGIVPGQRHAWPEGPVLQLLQVLADLDFGILRREAGYLDPAVESEGDLAARLHPIDALDRLAALLGGDVEVQAVGGSDAAGVALGRFVRTGGGKREQQGGKGRRAAYESRRTVHARCHHDLLRD